MKPCPFCGKGTTAITYQTYWSGMRSVPLSVTLHHWCVKDEKDEFVTNKITIRARDKVQAIEKWNNRK